MAAGCIMQLTNDVHGKTNELNVTDRI